MKPNFPAPQFNLKIMLHHQEWPESHSCSMYVTKIKTQFYVQRERERQHRPALSQSLIKIYVCSKIRKTRWQKFILSTKITTTVGTHKHTYTKSMLTRTHIHNICTMYSEWYSSKKEEDTVKRQHTYDDGEEMFSFCEN